MHTTCTLTARRKASRSAAVQEGIDCARNQLMRELLRKRKRARAAIRALYIGCHPGLARSRRHSFPPRLLCGIARKRKQQPPLSTTAFPEPFL